MTLSKPTINTYISLTKPIKTSNIANFLVNKLDKFEIAILKNFTSQTEINKFYAPVSELLQFCFEGCPDNHKDYPKYIKYMIPHGGKFTSKLLLAEVQSSKCTLINLGVVIKICNNYLEMFKRMLEDLSMKKDSFIESIVIEVFGDDYDKFNEEDQNRINFLNKSVIYITEFIYNCRNIIYDYLKAPQIVLAKSL